MGCDPQEGTEAPRRPLLLSLKPGRTLKPVAACGRAPTREGSHKCTSQNFPKYKRASGGNAEPLDPEVGRRCQGRRGLWGALRGWRELPYPALLEAPSGRRSPSRRSPAQGKAPGGLRCHNPDPRGLEAPRAGTQKRPGSLCAGTARDRVPRVTRKAGDLGISGCP